MLAILDYIIPSNTIMLTDSYGVLVVIPYLRDFASKRTDGRTSSALVRVKLI
jgi:hypothetical protein